MKWVIIMSWNIYCLFEAPISLEATSVVLCVVVVVVVVVTPLISLIGLLVVVEVVVILVGLDVEGLVGYFSLQ